MQQRKNGSMIPADRQHGPSGQAESTVQTCRNEPFSSYGYCTCAYRLPPLFSSFQMMIACVVVMGDVAYIQDSAKCEMAVERRPADIQSGKFGNLDAHHRVRLGPELAVLLGGRVGDVSSLFHHFLHPQQNHLGLLKPCSSYARHIAEYPPRRNLDAESRQHMMSLMSFSWQPLESHVRSARAATTYPLQ